MGLKNMKHYTLVSLTILSSFINKILVTESAGNSLKQFWGKWFAFRYSTMQWTDLHKNRKNLMFHNSVSA